MTFLCYASMLKHDGRHCALGVYDICGLPTHDEGKRGIQHRGSTIEKKIDKQNLVQFYLR